MEEIFNDKYIKALELVEKISPKLVENLYEIVNQLPTPVKKYIKKEKSCELTGLDKVINLNMDICMFELTYKALKTNIDTYLYIYPFFSSDLECLPNETSDDEHTMLLASITKANAEECYSFQLHYNQNKEGYDLDKIIIPNNAKEIDMSVYLDYIDNKFYLNYITTFNDAEIKNVKLEISKDELLEYVCDEDCEEDCYEDNDGFTDVIE